MEQPQKKSARISVADFVILIARYNCFERDCILSFLRIWHKVSSNAFFRGKHFSREFYSGSFHEGMPREVCNDTDVMFTLPHWPDVLLAPPTADSPNYNQGYVIPRDSEGHPGFVTLLAPPGVRYRDPALESYSEDIKVAIVDWKVGGETKTVFSSVKVIELREGGRGHISGPAVTQLANWRMPQKGEVDFVACFICPDWPTCASAFLKRPRPHGWPSQSLREKIQNAGCHVVALGPNDSPNREVEWCWAFSMAEKELIYNMTESMYVCLYLLRSIKNKHWVIEKKPNEPSVFSSYFIKAACMWISEETPAKYDNVLTLVAKVIDWLLTCYKNKKMPHYILPQKNLIERVVKDKNYPAAVAWLEDINSNLTERIQTSIPYNTDIPVVAKILRHLESSPGKPIPDDVMKEARHELRRDGEAYNRKERYALAKLATEYCFPFRYTVKRAIVETVAKEFPVEDLTWQSLVILLQNPFIQFMGKDLVNKYANEKASVAEDIFKPVLDDISSLTKPRYEGLTTAFLHRELGEIFHVIYTLLQECNIVPDNPAEFEIYNKAIAYFQKCTLVYSDDWSDHGLGKMVHMAIHYHTAGQWDDLADKLAELEPLLMEATDSPDILKSLPYIRVDPNSPLAAAGEHERHLAIWDQAAIHRHPVYIGFHLLEVVAKRKGESEATARFTRCKERVDGLLVGWD